MRARVRSLVPIVLLLGCAHAEVGTVPEPDYVRGIRWRNASPLNRSIDRLFGPAFLWGQWQLSGPITIVEGGVPAVYQAMVLELSHTDLAGPEPCRPDGYLALHAWRARPDNAGIDAISLYVQGRPATLDDASFGERHPCPGRQLAQGPVLVRAVVEGDRVRNVRQARLGQAHIAALESGPDAEQCRLVSGTLYDDPCEERHFGVTVRAVLTRVDSSGRFRAGADQLTIGPAIVPGIRQFSACRSPTTGLPCSDSIARVQARQRVADAKTRRVGSFWPISQTHVTSLGADTVLRTVVLVRYALGTSDSTIADAIRAWGAEIPGWGGGPTMVIQIPDPGLSPAAFARALERVRQTPGVAAAFAMRGERSPQYGVRAVPVAPPGRVVARLLDRAGRGLPNGAICRLPPPVDPTNSWCRIADSTGRAAFDSLEVLDHPIYAGCVRPGSKVVTRFDSTLASVEPAASVTLRFRRAPASCLERP